MENINNKTSDLDINSLILSICSFCKRYDSAPAILSNMPQAVVISRKLEILSIHIKEKICNKNVTSAYSKGLGSFTKTPWISVIPVGKKVSNSISVTLCFTRDGKGIVIGLMNPMTIKNILPTKKTQMTIDHKDKYKYDNKYINYDEFKIDSIEFKKVMESFTIHVESMIKLEL